MEKSSFLIHCDSLDVIEHMTDEQVGKLLRKMRDYHNGNTYSPCDAIVEIAFVSFKNQFDRDKEKFENICERNAKNGLKGGRPKKPKESKENPKNPVGYYGNPNKPKKAESDNDSDNDNDKENDSDNDNIKNIVVIQQESVPDSKKIYGNIEINDILELLKASVGVSDFKEERIWQRRYAKNFLNMRKNIGEEEFLYRLKTILEDGFKAKNCNKMAYLFGEMKSFIHSPIVEEKDDRHKIRTFII